MATLRDMLVKIYRPHQGIIEFGPGSGSTQDGATNLAVLGGGAGQADGGDQGGGGAVSFPAFRTAGLEGGAATGGGGGGGFDFSDFDPSNPADVQRFRQYLEGREGGQAGEPGGLDRDFGSLSGESIESMLGGYSTFGGILGTLTGLPGLGLIGSGIDTFNDYGRADEFDPTYDPSVGDVFSAFGYDVTSGALGRSMHSDAIGDYQGRTGTNLGEAALGAATGGTGSSYSGPKGVVGPRGMGAAAAGQGASESGLNRASRSSYQGGAGSYSGPKGVVGPHGRDLGGRGAEGGGRGGGGGFGCFVAGTMILLPDGSEKPIEAIRSGDTVAAFDGLGALQPRRVAHVMHYQDREPLTVRFSGGAVRVTVEHPFLVPSGEYVRAGDLAAGGHVVNAEGGAVEVLAIEPVTDTADVYNFEVEGLHTYVAAGLRVHNIKHQGGMIHGMPGEEVDETLLAGEYVMSPEAVETFGPQTFEQINNLARMMRSQHYPARG